MESEEYNVQKDTTIHDVKIEALLLEFEIHRDSIKAMIFDLEKIRSKVERLIPETLDARYIRLLEEKVKALTNLFNSLLEMRKEICKSVKDEIEIRRRITTKDDMVNMEDMLDIRDMVEKMEEFQESTKKLKQGRYAKVKEQKYDESIEIPGLTDGGK